ncbi:hypothetical protein N8987_03035 [Crocinitomix sp.]|nr:hypothetical protein [Crocinitomix sp.]
MKNILLLLWGLLSFSSFGQSAYADSLITTAMKKMQDVPAYECAILIDMDVSFINIDQRKGKVYFLPPDSIRYDIKGFAFLPKKGYNGHAYSVTESDFVALHLGTEIVHKSPCEIVKVIPNDIDSDVVLGQFWIDGKDRIHKMIIVTKEGGNYEIDLQYGGEKYPVPSKATIKFDVQEMKLPKTMTGDLEADDEVLDEKDKKKSKKGSITITYSDYIFK